MLIFSVCGALSSFWSVLHLSGLCIFPGSCLGRQWGVTAPQPPTHGELGSTELTVLNLLRDRRDSSGSATSSAYLSSSRRSSGISPCFSSRRSSQASQNEATMAAAYHRRLHNLSSTDSYDPISTDASRRSSEASHCGGGAGGGGGGPLSGGGCGGGVFGLGVGGGGGPRGMLSLTPAQHYHLKAKYAAATGGPPPTPLPSMERMVDDGGVNQPLPPLVRPHRCSDSSSGNTNGYTGHSGYRRRVLYPGEGSVNRNRRASDPVRTQAPDACSLPPVQRFNSLNSLHPLPPLSHHSIPENCSLSLQNSTRSEGNMQRILQHSTYNPSIAEHAALEALAMEEDGGYGFLLGDEDMLPDDLVQYLHSQVQSDSLSLLNIEDQLASSQRDTSYPSMEELEQIHSSGLDMSYPGSHSLQHQTAEQKSPSSLPIQWNEVSSGSADRSPHKKQNHQTAYGRWTSSGNGCASAPFGRFQNMVVQQKVPLEFQDSCSNVSQSPGACSGSPAVKLETLPNSCMEMRGTRGTIGRSTFSQTLDGSFPQVLKQQPANGPPRQSHFQLKHNSTTPSQDGINYGFSFNNLSHGAAAAPHRQVHAPHPPNNNYRNSVRAQQCHNSSNSGNMLTNTKQLLRKNGDHCSLAHHVSGLKLEAPDQGYSENGYGESLSYEQGDCKASSFLTLKDQCLLSSITEPVGQSEGIDDMNPVALLSPGADQVTSTVDSIVPPLDQGASMDFGAMLEDGFDQGSLGSGLLSPSIFQAMSRTSSRLTTPRASAAFHSVPPGLNNMAIGDMSSLLTTLAEESKFLAIMQ